MTAMDVTRNRALHAVALLSSGALVGALYLQHALDWQPCPLCILQRLAFIGCALLAVAALAARRGVCFRLFQVSTAVVALCGVAVALRHLWVKAHPAVSCGIDPLETAINTQWWVQQLPWLLKADGLCFIPLPPLLGLQLPVWSVIFLSGFAVLAVLHRPAVSTPSLS